MMPSGVQKSVSVTPQCLAIVLGRDKVSTTGNGSRSSNGHKIFTDFQDENRSSFWNPALVETVLSLEFVGFMRPGTLLVSGSELHLECLRGAWARRVLKAPRGYHIKTLGDIGGIEMQAVPQTQFVSLPEALCLLISGLNRAGQPATFPALLGALHDQFSGMSLPRREVVFATLQALAAEAKVYCMGEHYFVATPLMFQQYQNAVGKKQVWEQNKKHRQEVCSRECQTGASIVNGVAPYKPEKTRDQAISACAPDTGSHVPEQNGNKDKDSDAKDKPGFFKRWFRRSKSRDGKAKLKPEAKERPRPAEEEPKPEPAAPLIAFAAQFPPTEWLHDPRHLRVSAHQGLFSKSRRPRDKSSAKDRNSVWVDLEPGSGRPIRRFRQDARFTSTRYSTFPEHLNRGAVHYSPTMERRKKNRHRLSKYMSSSSECLHCVGPSRDPEKTQKNRQRQEQRTGKQRPETGELSPMSEPRSPDTIQAPLAEPTDVELGPTPEPGTKKDSDSALSASPLATDLSGASSNNYSTFSGSEGREQPPKQPLDHTYINVGEGAGRMSLPSPIPGHPDRTYENVARHLESTHFEEVCEEPEEESLHASLLALSIHPEPPSAPSPSAQPKPTYISAV